MRVLLVGGGKVGSFLAKELQESGHVVSVIEDSHDHAATLSDTAGVLVFEGDGTDVALLSAADVHRADWLLAVTGQDEVNLVACQLALTLGARQVLARLNNPLNRPTFEALEIPVVAVTDLMATLISREVDAPDFRQVALVGRGQLSVYEVGIPATFTERQLADVHLPRNSLLAAVVSGGTVAVPTSTTNLRPGDRVTVVSAVGLEDQVRDVLGYSKRRVR